METKETTTPTKRGRLLVRAVTLADGRRVVWEESTRVTCWAEQPTGGIIAGLGPRDAQDVWDRFTAGL